MEAPPKLELTGVGRRWGPHVALEAVDLTINPGERIALVGPSGSGKTSLVRLLMARLRPSSGTIKAGGVAISAMSPRQVRQHRQRCGLVDQGTLLIPRLSVHDNVIAGRVASWPWYKTLASTMWSFDTKKVRELLDAVGLGERQFDTATDLSGGQKQRVAIVRALASNQSILLADEPTAALDPKTAADVIALLLSETNKRSATLIVSTHRVSQVVEAVDRIIGLREGRIEFDEAADETTNEQIEALYDGSRELT